MSLVVPVVLILVIMAGVGAHITNYAGYTPYEAWDIMKNTHDYTCSQEQFDDLYDTWHQMQYANKPITQEDINKLLGYGDDLYNGAITYCENWIDYITGSFDDSWQADISSRIIKIFNADGVLVGQTEIVGLSDSAIYYNDRVTVMPQLVDDGVLLFRTISSDGTFYHNYITSIAEYNNTQFSTDLLYLPWYNISPSDKYASNVAFVPSIYRDNAVQIKGVSNGNTVVMRYSYVSPISGATNELETTVPYIGVATTDDGSEVGVRPDGSIVLPDGTIVYPDATTGAYPSPVDKVDLGDDFWVKLTELIAQTAATGESTAETDKTIVLNLEGLRAAVLGISEYLKSGFWSDFENEYNKLFTPDYTKYNTINYDNIYSVLNTYTTKIFAAFGLQSQNQGGVE